MESLHQLLRMCSVIIFQPLRRNIRTLLLSVLAAEILTASEIRDAYTPTHYKYNLHFNRCKSKAIPVTGFGVL
jgi:hypothetical protein